MASGQAAVSVSALHVAFGGVAAVDGLDVQVSQGEVVAVLGPNGSGKTTLLNAITGFVPAESGTVSLWDRDVTRLSTARRSGLRLGRTFQNLRVVPRVTVADLLQFGWHQRDPRGFGLGILRPLELAKRTRLARATAGEALEQVGLPAGLLGIPVTSLSQGQLKLVDIARALMAKPRILLLDEPTSGLSQSDVAKMARLIEDLRAQDITLIVVEHDVRFVLSFADRVVVMESGHVLAEGEPQETMRLPSVVQAYLGVRGQREPGSPQGGARTLAAERTDQ